MHFISCLTRKVKVCQRLFVWSSVKCKSLTGSSEAFFFNLTKVFFTVKKIREVPEIRKPNGVI